MSKITIATEEAARIARETSPLNRAAVRKMIFAILQAHRPELSKKLTRVSESSFQYLEGRLRNIVTDEVRNHASIGSTVYLGRR